LQKKYFCSSSQRFVDICEGRVPKGQMTLMKDIALQKTNAAGQYVYYKVQDIAWDDVFSKYILHPKVCLNMTLFISSYWIT
jgi:phytanoyl-CoA hydroxylase